MLSGMCHNLNVNFGIMAVYKSLQKHPDIGFLKGRYILNLCSLQILQILKSFKISFINPSKNRIE